MLCQLPFTLVCVFTIKYFSKTEKGRERERHMLGQQDSLFWFGVLF